MLAVPADRSHMPEFARLVDYIVPAPETAQAGYDPGFLAVQFLPGLGAVYRFYRPPELQLLAGLNGKSVEDLLELVQLPGDASHTDWDALVQHSMRGHQWLATAEEPAPAPMAHRALQLRRPG